jgi:DNA-binding response OmpR family regulator
MFKILVAEDEPHLRTIISKSLKNEGYTVIECFDGRNALEVFHSEHIDLVITDIMMPRTDGLALVNEIRKTNKDIPVLMLTALETIDDKTKGFDSGTDDYLVKPILMKVLCMRVKALLRRYKINSENKIVFNNSVLDFNEQSLIINGKSIDLAKKEFQLLFKLLANPDKVFSREKLLNEIWGYESDSTDRTVDTHISNLRKKAVSPDFEITSVWGLGYKAVLK